MLSTSTNRVHDFLIEEVDGKQDICVALDAHLNFLAANNAACEHINKSPYELIGRNILDLFPTLIASKNHRNFLKAISGLSIDDEIISMYGESLKVHYEPLTVEKKVQAIIVTAKRSE